MSGKLLIRDALRANFCRRGIRDKCAALGFDFETFRRNGWPIEEAAAVDDYHVKKAVAVARDRIAKGK